MTAAASALRRDDLDSLRGLAVLSVVLFHLNVPVFTNGHLGVDVFFVLSGYFIFSSHCRANKSLYEFFPRRLWRIFPGYFVFLALFACSMTYFLLQEDYIDFVVELAKAACFVSNFQSTEENKGYFAKVQEHHFLLHTWSLSVEIQFYILSALLAIIIRKTGSISAAAMGAFSLSSHYFVSENVSFYSLPCRIWQFLAGYAAVVIQDTYFKSPEFCEEKEVVTLHEDQQFDTKSYVSKRSFSMKTLCICLITIICLISNFRQHMLVQRVLITFLSAIICASTESADLRYNVLWNNKLLHFFGTISYSWYLWHWPVSVLFSYYAQSFNVSINLIIYLSVPIVLASACTYGIERPLQRMAHSTWTTVSLSFLPSALFISWASFYLVIYKQSMEQSLEINSTIMTTYPLLLGAPSIAPEIQQTSTKFSAESSTFNIISSTIQTRKEIVMRVGSQFNMYQNDCFERAQKRTNPCFFGNVSAPIRTAVLGDSQGLSAFGAHKFLPDIAQQYVAYFGTSGCRPYLACPKYAFDKETDYEGCANSTRDDVRFLGNSTFNRIVLCARHMHSFPRIDRDNKPLANALRFQENCLYSTLKELNAMPHIREIIVVKALPEALFDVASVIARSADFKMNLDHLNIVRSNREALTSPVNSAIENAARRCGKCQVVDPLSVMCDSKICPTFDNSTRQSYFNDFAHMNDYGLQKLSRLFQKSGT